MRLRGDRRVDRRDPLARHGDLRRPEVRGRGEELPVQVVLLEDVGVDEHEGPDAEPRQLLDEIAAEAAAADDGDPAAEQPELVRDRHRLAVAPVASGQELPSQGGGLDVREAPAEALRRLALRAPGRGGRPPPGTPGTLARPPRPWSPSSEQREDRDRVALRRHVLQLRVPAADEQDPDLVSRDPELVDDLPERGPGPTLSRRRVEASFRNVANSLMVSMSAPEVAKRRPPIRGAGRGTPSPGAPASSS